MHSFELYDNGIRIDYDPEAGAFYISLHTNGIFPAVARETEVLATSPIINVDKVGGTVVGIEIIP